MYNIAVFASGSGSNAENTIRHFNIDACPVAKVALVLSNKKNAYVLQRAKNFDVPSVTFTYEEFLHEEHMMPILESYHIDFIMLAGFLLKVPAYLLAGFPDRILNIHPALLPNYGGKGMYGEHVHKAVIAAREKESGITIHVIDNNYDCGRTIFQSRCPITSDDTPETLAAKIHELEREYPRVAEEYMLKLK